MPDRTAVVELELTAAERDQLTELAQQACDGATDQLTDEFFHLAPVLAQQLPLRLRAAFTEMRQRELGYAHIRGLQVADSAIGPTPDRWRDPAAQLRTRLHECQITLLGSLLGELFGWSSQQDGSIVHDVLPMREYQDTQINFASKEPIWWHTEDAFHPYRPDYVGLMCLRNPQRAATTVSCAADWDLSDPKYDVLFEEHFEQRPDHAHGRETRTIKPRPVLTGDRDAPYACLDPYYLDEPAVERVARVLRDFYEVVDAALTDVVLAPGDVLFVDNHRAVHGRRPFAANYDGRDRWLKRVSVSRDLRHCWPAWTRSHQVLDGTQC